MPDPATFDFDTGTAFVLLDDSRPAALAGPSWLFTQPIAVETAADGDVRAALARLRDGVLAGGWAAGYLSYEAGLAFEPKLSPRRRTDDALMWFGLFAERRAVDAAQLWSTPQPTPALPGTVDIAPCNWDIAHHEAAVRDILGYIAAGDIYQANLTFQSAIHSALSAVALYKMVRAAQQVAHGALMHDGAGQWILSFSPELFFSLSHGKITARPMKGTSRRAPLLAPDTELANALKSDPKNRAENLMIVDLLRNDLAKVCVPGSIKVPDLFTVETLPTVHAMTSTITGTVQPGLHPVDLLAALFPCGSITGAPKIRAMEIIDACEVNRRGVYCGSIGAFSADAASFNVAIRTLSQAAPGQAFTLGLGSGVVADSDPAAEWRECLLKAAFLTQPVPPFDLFETLRWCPDGGLADFEAHVARLMDSARYWQFACNQALIEQEASAFTRCLTQLSRVRLMLSPAGKTAWQAQPLRQNTPEPLPILIAPQPMRSDDVFLFHKTTHRAFYDDVRHALNATTGCAECLFVNERGELTEGSYTTLFVRIDGVLRTPELACGFLPGILRQKMIASGAAREDVLTPADLAAAEAIFIGNSVRGMMQARLMQPGERVL